MLRLQEATDPAVYSNELIAVLFQIGKLSGTAETGMIELLDEARQNVLAELAQLDMTSPSRAMLNRAQAGIEGAMGNLSQNAGTTIAQWQTQGHALGVDLAIKPLGGERGLEIISAAISVDQLQILQSYSAELIQDIGTQLRKRINGEIAAVVIGAKSPTAAAAAIGLNLTDANHFSSIAHRARAIVVTEVGRAQALGTQAAQMQLQKAIYENGGTDEVRKRWLNAHLPGARATHVAAENNYSPDGDPGPVGVNGFFQIGAYSAFYPKDPALPASESVHCHCVALTVVDEGSSQAAANPAALAPAKAAYGGAKAEAAVGADTKQSKVLNAPATTFLANPYTSAGLNPVKSLKNGGMGYGGKVMAEKLGYATPTESGFIWNKEMGAFVHKNAPSGKQLPGFDKLSASEQLGLMNSAGLSGVTKNQIAKHLDVELPKKKIPKVAKPTPPTAAPPPPPKPKPPPAPKSAPPPTPRATPSGALPALTPAGKVGAATAPRISSGKYLARIREVLNDSTATAAADRARTGMKKSIQQRIATRMTAKGITDEIVEGLDADLLGYAYGAESPVQSITAKLIRNWANTSGDRNHWSLAMQKTAADMFDLPWPPTGYNLDVEDFHDAARRALRDTIPEVQKKYRHIFEPFLEAMYEETQAELELLFPGKDTITMVRGMRAGISGSSVVNATEVMLNPLSSFAIAKRQAKKFGRTLFWANVPKERIIGCATSGFGCLNEYEFVVLGAKSPEVMSFTSA